MSEAEDKVELVSPLGEEPDQAIGAKVSGEFLPLVRAGRILYFAKIDDEDTIVAYNIPEDLGRMIPADANIIDGKYIIKTARGDISVPVVNRDGVWIKNGPYEAAPALKSDALDKLLMDPLELFINVASDAPAPVAVAIEEPAPVAVDSSDELVDDDDFMAGMFVDGDIELEETVGIISKISTVDLDRIDRLLTELYPSLDDLMLSKFSRAIVRMVKDSVAPKDTIAGQLLNRRGLPRWIVPVVNGKTTIIDSIRPGVSLQDAGFTDVTEVEVRRGEEFMPVVIPGDISDVVEMREREPCNSPDQWYKCRTDFTMPVLHKGADARQLIRQAHGGSLESGKASRLAVTGFIRLDRSIPYVRLFDIKKAKPEMLDVATGRGIHETLNALYPTPAKALLENAESIMACPNMRAVEMILRRYNYSLQDVDKDIFDKFLRGRYAEKAGSVAMDVIRHQDTMKMVHAKLLENRKISAHDEGALLSESYGYIRQIEGLSTTQLRILLNSTEDYGNNYYLTRVHQYLTNASRERVLKSLAPSAMKELPEGVEVSVHQPVIGIKRIVQSGRLYSIDDYLTRCDMEHSNRKSEWVGETLSDMQKISREVETSQRMLDYLIMQKKHDRRLSLLESLDIRLAPDYRTDSRIARIFDGFNLSTEEGRKQYVDMLDQFTALNRAVLIDGFYRVRDTGDIICCTHFHYQLRSGLENFVEQGSERPDFVEDAGGFKRCKYCHSPITDDEDTGIQFTGGEMNLRHTFRHMITGERDSDEQQEQVMLNSDLYIFLEHMTNRLLADADMDLPSGKMSEMLRKVYTYIRRDARDLLDPYSPSNRKYSDLLSLLKDKDTLSSVVKDKDERKARTKNAYLLRVLTALNPAKGGPASLRVAQVAVKTKASVNALELHTHFMLMENVRRMGILIPYLSYYVDMYSAKQDGTRFLAIAGREWIIKSLRAYHTMRKQVWISYKAGVSRLGEADADVNAYIDTLIKMYSCTFELAGVADNDVILPWAHGTLETSLSEDVQHTYGTLRVEHAIEYAALTDERREQAAEARKPLYIGLAKQGYVRSPSEKDIVELENFMAYEANGLVDAAKYLQDIDTYTASVNENLADFQLKQRLDEKDSYAYFPLHGRDMLEGAQYDSLRESCYYSEMFMHDSQPLSVDTPLRPDGDVDMESISRPDLVPMFTSYQENVDKLKGVKDRPPAVPEPETRGAMMRQDVPYHSAKMLTINSSQRIYDERHYPVSHTSKSARLAGSLQDESMATFDANPALQAYIKSLIRTVKDNDPGAFNVLRNDGRSGIFENRDQLFRGLRETVSRDILYDSEMTYMRTLAKVRSYASDPSMDCVMADFLQEDIKKYGRWTMDRKIRRMQCLGNYLSAAITGVGYKYSQLKSAPEGGLPPLDEELQEAIDMADSPEAMLLQQYASDMPEIYSLSTSELGSYVTAALSGEESEEDYRDEPLQLVALILPVAIKSDICRHIKCIRTGNTNPARGWNAEGVSVQTRQANVRAYVKLVDELLNMAMRTMQNMDPDHAEFDHLQYMTMFNKVNISKRASGGKKDKAPLDEGLAAAISAAVEVTLADQDEEDDEGDGQPEEREELVEEEDLAENEIGGEIYEGEGEAEDGEPDD